MNDDKTDKSDLPLAASGSEPKPNALEGEAQKAEPAAKSDYDKAQDAEDAEAKSEKPAGDKVVPGVSQEAKLAVKLGEGAKTRDVIGNQQVNQQVNNYKQTRINNIERAQKDAPIRDPIDPTEPEKLETVFVAPESFEGQKEKLKADAEKPETAHRIIVVHGEESTGRYAVALRLGSLLLGKKPTELVWFRPVASMTRTVKEVVESIQPKAGGVYVIRDAFGADGLKAEQFSNWHEANKLLKGSWLLITASTQVVPHLPQNLARVESGNVDMTVALAKHVAWYEVGGSHATGTATTGRLSPAVAKQIKDDLTKLAAILIAGQSGSHAEAEKPGSPVKAVLLGSPVKADLFCRRVLTDVGVRDALTDPTNTNRLSVALAVVARQIAAGDLEAAARWFKGLNRNAQLFALLLGLFSGVRRSLLERLYEEVVFHLRQVEKLECYDDVREYGFNDLYRDLNVRPEKMEFADPAFAEHVEGQIQNYGHLLMSLLGVVLRAVRLFGARDHWELRLRIGQFAGRYGIPQFDRLKELMDELAQDRSGRVSVIGAYAAAELALRTSQHDQPLTALLTSWIDSGDGDMVWTAGIALQRLYPVWFVDPDRAIAPLRLLLTRLAERSDEIYNPRFRSRVERDEQDLLKRNLGCEKLTWGEMEDREFLNEVIRSLVERRIADSLDDCARVVGLAVADGVFLADPQGTVKVLQEWLAPDPPTKDAEADDDPDETEKTEKDEKENPKPVEPAATNETKQAAAKAATEKAELVADRRQTRRQRGAEVACQLFLETRTGPGEFEALGKNHEALLELLPNILAVELEPPAAIATASNTLTDTVMSLEEVDIVQTGLVEPVLRVLAGWLRYPDWRPRVALAILKAINRSTPRQRQRLRRGLLHTWLRDDRETRELPVATRAVARQFAEEFLLRERLLGGAVSDFPGGGRGLLFVDASREGRPGGSAVDLVSETYHRLRAQTDLTVGWLGRTELFTPTGAQLTHDRIRPGHHHPRLLLPALTPANFSDPQWKDNTPFTAADVHFVLVPHWGQLDDGEDVLTAPKPNQPPDPTWELWKDRLITVPLGGNLNAIVDLQDDLDDLTPELLAKIRAQNPDLADFLEEDKYVLGMEAIRAVRDNRKNIEWLFDNWLHPLVESTLASRLVARPRDRWRALMASALGVPAPLADHPDAIAQFLDAAVSLLNAGARDLDEIASTEPAAENGKTHTPDRVRALLCVLQGVAAHNLKTAVDVVVGWLQMGDDLGRTLGIAASRSLLRVHVDTRLDRDGRWIGTVETTDPVFEVFRLAPGLARHELAPRLGMTLLLRAARAMAANPNAAQRLFREPKEPGTPDAVKENPTGLVAATRYAAKDKPELRGWVRAQLAAWDRPLPPPTQAAVPRNPAAPNRDVKPIFDPFGRDTPKVPAGDSKSAAAPLAKPSTEGVSFLADRLAGQLRLPSPPITPNRYYGVLLLEATSSLYDNFAKELQKVLAPAMAEDIQILVFRVGTTRPVASGRKSAPVLPFVGRSKEAPHMIGPILEQPELFAKVRFVVMLASDLPLDFSETQEAIDERRLSPLEGREPRGNERSRYATGFLVRERDDPVARACGWELVLCPNLANPARAPIDAARFADRFIFPVTGRRSSP